MVKKKWNVHENGILEEDVKGRELFASWAKRLGMTCHVDEAGNLIAHMDGQDNDLPAIMMGSHLDTVPDGGRYDGVTGCVGGLEVCEVLKEHGKVPKHPDRGDCVYR